MSESEIKELEEKIANLKKQKQLNEFQKLLNDIVETDYTEFLENKIFEDEYGCWVRDNNSARYPDNSAKYPEKIYKHVNETIKGYNKIKYFEFDKEVSEFPNDILDILELHRYPNQICKIIIDDQVSYRYNFSSKLLEKYKITVRGHNIFDSNKTDIYKILYGLIKKLNK